MCSNKYSTELEVLNTFSKGEFVIVVCEDKEKEGDFFVLSEYTTPKKVNFLLTYSKGMICVACDQKIIDHFELPPMVGKSNDVFGTNFTVSVDADHDISTGVSASDRAKTISIMANSEKFSGKNLVRPGHTHPLCAKNPIDRWGHTECSVEMAKYIGKKPVVTICEILNEEGEKANRDELFKIAKRWNMPITSTNKMKEFLGFNS